MATIICYASDGHGNGGTLFPSRSNFGIELHLPPPGLQAFCYKGFSSPLSSSSNFFLTDFSLPVGSIGNWASLTVHVEFFYYDLIGNFLGVEQPSIPPQPMFQVPAAQIAVGAHLIDAFGFGPHLGPDSISSNYSEGDIHTWEYTWLPDGFPSVDDLAVFEVGGTLFSTEGCNVSDAVPTAGSPGDFDRGQYAYVFAFPWFTVETKGSYCYGYRGTYSPSFGA